MQKYKVTVRGSNLLGEIDGARQRLGFYTTVLVEAFNSADAERRALEYLSSDEKLQRMMLNRADNPMSLSAGEIREADAFDAISPSRTGLAFFQENGPQPCN